MGGKTSMCSVAQSCPTLCDPIGCSPPGSSVHQIPQARILEWVAISSSRGSNPGIPTHISCISCIGRWILYHWRSLGSPGKPVKPTKYRETRTLHKTENYSGGLNNNP